VLAGVFCFVVATILFSGHFRNPTSDVLKSPPLDAARKQLRTQPTDEPLKQRIRDLDLRVRQRYFRQQSLNHSGAYLLLGGLALALFAAKRVLARREDLPQPQLNHDAQ
jgi:hypothetical protein